MTWNTKSVVKILEILKLSVSCNIVGVVDSNWLFVLTFWRISIILFGSVRLGLVKHWLAQSPKLIHCKTPIPGVDYQKFNLIHVRIG